MTVGALIIAMVLAPPSYLCGVLFHGINAKKMRELGMGSYNFAAIFGMAAVLVPPLACVFALYFVENMHDIDQDDP